MHVGASLSRSTIAVAARPLIDKKVLLERLHRCLERSKKKKKKKKRGGGGDLSSVTPFNYRYFLDHASSIGGRILRLRMWPLMRLSRWEERVVSTCGEHRHIPAITCRGWMQSPKEVRGFMSRQTPAERERYFPDAHFDLVLSNQVLEHVTDPEAVITDRHRSAAEARRDF